MPEHAWDSISLSVTTEILGNGGLGIGVASCAVLCDVLEYRFHRVHANSLYGLKVVLCDAFRDRELGLLPYQGHECVEALGEDGTATAALANFRHGFPPHELYRWIR